MNDDTLTGLMELANRREELKPAVQNVEKLLEMALLEIFSPLVKTALLSTAEAVADAVDYLKQERGFTTEQAILLAIDGKVSLIEAVKRMRGENNG